MSDFINISSGVTSSGALSGSYGKTVNVLSGGTAVDTTIAGIPTLDTPLQMNVFSGGYASDTIIDTGGLLTILSGGTATEVIINPGGGEEIDEGTAISTFVSFDEEQEVYGLAIQTNLDEAYQLVMSGGTALDTIVTKGGINFFTGGAAGVQTIDAGATASGTFLYSSSHQTIGGTAIDTTATDQSQINILSGGTAISAVIESGSFDTISSGGFASGTILSGGSELDEGLSVGAFVSSAGVLSVGGTDAVASAVTIAGGTVQVGSGGVVSDSIVFTGTGGIEISGGTVATAISGFASGDTIDVQTLVFTGSGTTSFDASDDVLTVTEGGSSIALQLAGSYTDTPFILSADAGSGTLIDVSSAGTTSNLPCFAAGTRIMTERGEIAVEQLTIGDRVARVDGDTKPITWIGSRRVDCRHHPEPAKVWPVRIAAQAFGPGAPRRDLLLSPDHAIFVEGVLIPVKHLINGTTILQIATPAVTYLHVELDRHAVILAEGLPVESYLDTGDRSAFGTEDGPTMLHPAFGSERADTALVAEALSYAPLRVTGAEVAAVKARLADRAALSALDRFDDAVVMQSASGSR